MCIYNQSVHDHVRASKVAAEGGYLRRVLMDGGGPAGEGPIPVIWGWIVVRPRKEGIVFIYTLVAFSASMASTHSGCKRSSSAPTDGWIRREKENKMPWSEGWVYMHFLKGGSIHSIYSFNPERWVHQGFRTPTWKVKSMSKKRNTCTIHQKRPDHSVSNHQTIYTF